MNTEIMLKAMGFTGGNGTMERTTEAMIVVVYDKEDDINVFVNLGKGHVLFCKMDIESWRDELADHEHQLTRK